MLSAFTGCNGIQQTRRSDLGELQKELRKTSKSELVRDSGKLSARLEDREWVRERNDVELEVKIFLLHPRTQQT